jgi:hypothetical protein
MENEQTPNHGKHHEEQFVEVAISTTSGFYPSTGYERVSIHQKIEVMLHKAAKALNLTDTSNWVVSVNKSPIDPSRSYEESGLKGRVDIDWGPREGGGGNA